MATDLFGSLTIELATATSKMKSSLQKLELSFIYKAQVLTGTNGNNKGRWKRGGYREHIPKYMQRMSFFLLPSYNALSLPLPPALAAALALALWLFLSPHSPDSSCLNSQHLPGQKEATTNPWESLQEQR